MAKTTSEELLLLHCEKVVNETWTKISLYFDEIKRIVENGEIMNEDEEAILLIAANAALQKMVYDRAVDKKYNLLNDIELTL